MFLRPRTDHPVDIAVDALALHLFGRSRHLAAARWDAAVADAPDLYPAVARVRAVQPVDPPPVRTAAALDALLAFGRAGGVHLAPGLEVSVDGVRATGLIPAGTVLVDVPLTLAIRSRDVLEHPALGPWLAGELPFGPGALMLWLVVERYGDGATHPYAAALPDVPGTALSWPHPPGSHLAAAAAGDAFRAGVLQLYVMLYKRLLETPEADRPLPLEAFTLQRWLWAGAVLSSRQNAIDGELALVPLWDLLDHDESLGEVNTSADEHLLRCLAGRDHAPGEAVGMFYGGRTPTEHWVHAGFVTPGPPDGPAPRRHFPLPTEAPARRDKLIWLFAQDDAEAQLPVGPDLAAALARARWYALDHAELEHLGLPAFADAWPTPPPMTVAGEARARQILDRWLTGLAGPPEPVAPLGPEHRAIHAAARAFYLSVAHEA